MVCIVDNMINRRELLALIAGAFAPPLYTLAATNPPSGAYRVWQQRYRANAVILFCGVQIFSKSDVGGGYAVVEELRSGENSEIALQFAGGSWPEKAHGINRLGFIQETVMERQTGEAVEARYFGFMTSSAEKNFEQAKQSFSETGAKPVPYTATQGAARSGRFPSTIYRMFFPNTLTWADCPRLIRDVRANVDSSSGTPQEPVSCKAPNTFLNSVRQALLNPAAKTEGSLVYNSKLYTLETEKQPEGAQLTRLTGTLHESATGQKTTFRLWYEKDGASFLPVRIEYRAKSFLRLIFEKDSSVQLPATTMFLKENA
jgi:hypothetical protein